MHARHARRTLLVAAYIVGAMALLRCGSGIRQDELDCEEAVARLTTCCPGFAATTWCKYEVWTSCDTNEVVQRTHPAITEDESRCIRDMSCSDLKKKGVCDRARDAKPIVERYDDGGADAFYPGPEPTPHTVLCP